MKKLLSAGALSLLILASCASKSDTQSSASTETAAVEMESNNIVGKWQIYNIVVSDSVYVHPLESTPEEPSFMEFFTEEGQNRFSAQTNCNNVMGSYEISGDTIKFDQLASTRMACPDMTVEQLLGVVLPEITQVDFQNDSTARLNAPDGKYIVLQKVAAE